MNINQIIREIYEGEESYDRIKLSNEIYGQAANEIREIIERKIAQMR
jgi:hypothetical protein